MNQPFLIVITWLPASGKTTFGRRISEELWLPFFSKDDLKEVLFEHLGQKNREWSVKIWAAWHHLLHTIAEAILKAGGSLIIENSFYPQPSGRILTELQEKYGFSIIQLLFYADGETLFERFKIRNDWSEFHSGHKVDARGLEEFRLRTLSGKIDPLVLNGELFEVDTSNFEKVNLAKIIQSIRAMQSWSTKGSNTGRG